MARRSYREMAEDRETAAGEILSSLDDLSAFLKFQQENLNLGPENMAVVDKVMSLVPIVAVVGDQSSAKSSFLSAVTGYELSFGDNTTTICRFEIRLRKSNEIAARAELVSDGKIEASVDISSNLDLSSLHDQIKNMTGGQFTEKKIIVTVTSPTQSNVTFVDLPGILANNGSNGGEIMKIERMIQEYISVPNCLIIHVVNSQSDPGIINSRRLIRLFDPNNERTVTVYTKLDRPNGTHDHVVNKVRTIDPNGVFVWCRDPACNWRLVGIDEEKEFLKAIVPNGIRYGRKLILDRVESFTHELINKNRDNLVSTLVRLRQVISSQLESLGRPGNPLTIHFSWLQGLDKQLEDIEAGQTQDVQAEFEKIRDAIHKTVYDVFPLALDKNEIQHKLKRIQGNQLVGTVGNGPIVREFAHQAVEHITPGVNTWFTQFEDFIRELIKYVLNSNCTPAACRQVGSMIVDNCVHDAMTEMKGLKKILFEQLERTHSNPALYNEEELEQALHEYRNEVAKPIRALVQKIKEGSGDCHFIIRVSDEILQEVNKAFSSERIKDLRTGETIILIKTYWQKRMKTLQNDLFHQMRNVFIKVIQIIKNTVENLDQELQKLLIEPPELEAKRDLYKETLRLISEAITSLRSSE